MANFITKSLKNKLVVLFLLVSIIPLSIIDYVNYRKAGDILEKQALASVDAVANARKSDITHLIQLRQEQVKELAGTFLPRQLKSSGVNDPEDIAKIQTHIESVLQEMKRPPESGYGDIDKSTAIEIIGIWDTEGIIVANTNKELIGKKMSDHYLQGVKSKGTFFGGFNIDVLTGENFLIFLQAIRNFEDEKFAGAVVFKVSAQILNDITTDRTGLGDTGEVYLINKDYFMITESIYVDDAILKQNVDAPIVRECFAGEESIGIYPDYRGVPIVGSAKLMKDLEWCLLAEIDTAEAFAPAKQLGLITLSGSIIITLLVALVAYLVARGIARPIRELSDLTKKVAEGDLDVQVDIRNTKDETGILANTFNVMATKLKESYEDLEHKIAERTSALELSNTDMKRKEELDSVYNEIVTILNSSMETSELLSKSLNRISSFTNSQVGIIYLYDEIEQCLSVGACYAIGDADIKLEKLAPGIGIPGQVAQAKERILIKEVPEDTIFKIKHGMGDSIPRNIGSFPILLQDKVMGVLVLASLKEYPDEIMDLISNINIPLAIAISNTRSFELVQEQAEELKSINEELQIQTEELETQAGELRAKQEALEDKNREVEQANQTKSEFLANTSHELRTPLNSIIGFSEILEDKTFGELNAKQNKYVNNIHTSGRQLLQLINDILDLSKVEAGKMEISYKRFSIPDAMRDIEAIIKTQLEKKNISLETEIDENLTSITADQKKFKQIMYNLLSNAIKFTPADGQITVKAECLEGFARISVSDTGIGIRPEDLERIFAEFQQIDSKTSRTYEGTGLGLSLTRKFVEMHGGKIWVESKLGKSSTFTFTLPLTAKASQPAEELSLLEDIDGIKGSDEGPLILVVEDDPKSSELISIYLIQEGYRVATAFNGNEAVEKARELKPTAITLDIILPDREGWEVLRELKEMPETRDIPVIIISILENRKRGFSLGAIDYLTKPISKGDLLRALERCGFVPEAGGTPVRVLVVDDEPKTVELVATVLEAEGYEVQKAYGGQEGIDLATTEDQDLIILDLMMPEVDGFTVVEELKKHPQAKDVPIIISTAKDLTEEDFEQLKGKVDSIAQKGCFSKKDLLRCIKKIEKIEKMRKQ